MVKINTIGLLLMIGGFLLVVFQGISMFMGTEAIWKSITLGQVLGEGAISFVDGISIFVIHKALYFIIKTPLYIMCFVVGGGLLILKSFLWR